MEATTDNLASCSMETLGRNPFNALPIELNQSIASFLENDSDIAAYQLTCVSARDAVEGHNHAFWRGRFLRTFERPTKELSNSDLKLMYKARKSALKNGANFGRAHKNKVEFKKVTNCLEQIRDIIVDAYSEKPESDANLSYESRNMALLANFVLSHNLFGAVLKRPYPYRWHPSVGSLLYTIQAVLAPYMISLESSYDVYSFPDTQFVVYACANERPIFVGVHNLNVQMEWLLYNINFWRYHMTRPDEMTLYHPFSELDTDERPHLWQRLLRQGHSDLGKHWKGSYGFVDRAEIAAIRSGAGFADYIQDDFNMESADGTFQDMTLQLTSDGPASWPPVFEEILNSRLPGSPRMTTRAQRSSHTPELLANKAPLSFRFTGTGHDNAENFRADGWLNELPPHNGIPGWQRMTMMKYYVDEFGHVDQEALWAYEGVVMPGGQIIFGRWWCPSDGTGANMYSGPFILWCVDGPKYLELEDEEGEAAPS